MLDYQPIQDTDLVIINAAEYDILKEFREHYLELEAYLILQGIKTRQGEDKEQFRDVLDIVSDIRATWSTSTT